MKKVLLFVPVVLSVIVLGAHFMRDGNQAGVVGAVVLLALLFIRRRWVARLTQAVLFLGTLEWIRTIHLLTEMRAAQGQPFGRMVVILCFVAAFTFCSAWLFQTATLKKTYPRRGQ